MCDLVCDLVRDHNEEEAETFRIVQYIEIKLQKREIFDYFKEWDSGSSGTSDPLSRAFIAWIYTLHLVDRPERHYIAPTDTEILAYKTRKHQRMTEEIHTKVLIIGSGPAGYTAAIYAARACLDPVLVQGLQPGGQMTITTDVENYPGFADVIQGPWLMEQMSAQAEQVGTRMISDIIVSVDLSQRPFIAVGDSGTQYSADSVIITTGAQAKWLGLPSEDMFQGFGVSACATCDGFFYREKETGTHQFSPETRN